MPLRRLVFAVLSLLCASAASAQVAPDGRWMAFETEHFRVTHPPELEELARRAAVRAERAYEVLSRELVPGPRTIELVVTDHMDMANGMASPIPRPQVILWANPPSGVQSLAYYDDWLDQLIVHELVHVFHLDHRSRGWRALSTLFGRNPFLFPQLWTPGWVIEGLGVYYESLLTEGGRVRGTYHDMVLRTAILQDAFFSLDRATGDPLRWPSGSTRYIYGSLFIDHLARTHGADRIPAFVEAVGGQLVPFRPDAPARRVFGVSFGEAWREWEDSLRIRYSAQADSLGALGITQPETLVRERRVASFPRYAPSGDRLVYMSATGVDEPSARLLRPDGTVEVLGRVTALEGASWRRDGSGFLTSQLEYADRHRILSDLYEMGAAGERRRLTRGGRVWEPDLHPGGRTVVAVANARGTNQLVVHDLETGERRTLVPPSSDVHWSAPRWSPDGTRIAAARWSSGGIYSIVVLRPDGSVEREVTRDRAVDGTPAWSPDGRYLVFSSDRTGVTNLYAYDLEERELRQVTNLLTGAFQPDVSPDGRWIAFSHYHAEGYEIARVPFDPAAWHRPRPARPSMAVAGRTQLDVEGGAPIGSESQRYSPWHSLRPWLWFPLLDQIENVGTGLGAAVYGNDVLLRHEYVAQASYFPASGRAEALLEYAYAGLGNPVVTTVLEQDWRVQLPVGTAVGSEGDTLSTALLRRDRSAWIGADWVRPATFRVTSFGAGAEVTARERAWDEPDRAPAGLAIRQIPDEVAGVVRASVSTARGFGFTFGPQQGVSLGTTLSAHRYLSPLEGESGTRGYTRATARSRAYQPLGVRDFARNVLALRLDGGLETGSISPGFELGGTGSGIAVGPIGPIGQAIGFPVRGYPAATQRGDRALLASAELRFPVALVERGVGVLPAYFSRLTADLFVDAGTAWCSARCDAFPGAPTRPTPLLSAGAEAIAELRFGYLFDLPVRLGFAVPLEAGRRPAVYVQTGRAF